MDREALLSRARNRGVNPLVYWLVRGLLQPFFIFYFRMSRVGREHIPAEGPFIIASNHRSFLDPFVIGMLTRRPIYYVAKRELFANRLLAWLLSSLGAFPIERGASDQQAMATAQAILERGDGVLMFPEGTRTRPGPLGRPKRGVGRLALETGAPVVPVAVFGSEAVRKGFIFRPHKVRIRAGRPLTFPRVDRPSPALAAAVTDRIWPCIQLQWEWLGGMPSVRRVAVIGAGSWGTALAVILARAGLDVDVGCRTAEQATHIRETRRNERYLPGVELPADVAVVRAADLELAHHDLVCLAVPPRALPAVMAAHGERIPHRAGVLVLSRGLVAPLGTLPSAFVAERTHARAVACVGGPAVPSDVLAHGAALVVASADAAFLAQVADTLAGARLDVSSTRDVTGVELAGAATEAAVLAAAAASVAGPNAAGAAAGKVFAEVGEYAQSVGGRPETFAGIAGAGDLVASVVAGEAVGAVDEALPLLAAAVHDRGVEAPALSGLADVVEGRVEAERWATALMTPTPVRRRAA